MSAKLKVYEYPKCSTCQKALKFLNGRGAAFDKIDITEQPPSGKELKTMLGYVGEVRKLFNTSGLVYKEMGLSTLLKDMTETQALALLASNGRLVKRPFVLGKDFGMVGFREDEWKEHL